METGKSELENRPTPVIPVPPWREESTSLLTDVDPRLRGGDNNGYFHLVGLAAGPCALSTRAGANT